MIKTEQKIEKGLNRYEAEMLNSFLLMLGKLDKDKRVSDRQLRRMLYQTGVYVYRHYHNLGGAEDSLYPSMNAPAKPHPMKHLVKSE